LPSGSGNGRFSSVDRDDTVVVEGGGRPLRGEVTPPGDKSISHRAVILGGVSSGRCAVRGLLLSRDVVSTIEAMRALGVRLTLDGDGVSASIEGVGLHGLSEPEQVIDAGNSGTTARLLMGLLSPQPFFSVLTGDRYLRARPMGRVTKPLSLMGARIAGRAGAELLPVAVEGRRLRGITYRPPQASAQVKSALLLAGLYAEGETVVEEQVPTRDHTERMLSYMGVALRRRDRTVCVSPPARLNAVEVHVPGDISSAAYLIGAVLINEGSEVVLRGVGLNPLRTGVIDVLRRMGARIEVVGERLECGEPVGDVVAKSSPLVGVTVEGSDVPRTIDELPLVAAVACFARGTTVIRDAAELRVKETDRIAAMAAELAAMGARVEEREDGLVIEGGGRLRGARCSSHGDHRVAMSVAVAATAAEGETVIEGADCVDVSFPGFFDTLESLR